MHVSYVLFGSCRLIMIRESWYRHTPAALYIALNYIPHIPIHMAFSWTLVESQLSSPRIMLLLSAVSKWFRRWRYPSWLQLLPTELRIELLLTIGAQHNSIDSVMTLAREFPEFGELVLVLHWTRGSLLDVGGTNIKVVALYDYAVFPKKQSDERPVRIIIKDFTDPHISFPYHQVDGSSSCLLNRFINSRTMVQLQMPSEHCSLSLLNNAPVPFVQCTVESSSSSTLCLDYKQLETHAKRHCSGKPFQADSYFTLTPTLMKVTDNKLYDHTYWRLNDTSCRLESLVVYNCPLVFNVNFGCHVEVVEIRFNSEQDESVIMQQLIPNLVIMSNCPTQVLHVTFDSCPIPIFTATSDQFSINDYHNWAGGADFFTLQNANWSHTNPYGLTVDVPDENNGAPYGEMDQATFIKETCRQLELLNERDPWRLKLPLSYYTGAKLYGVPDTSVIWSSFNNVVCLYWWRLTPRVVDTENDRPAPIIRCPSLKELHIISVIRENERRPLFQAPRITKLVLISLHDSDVPWSIEDTLFGGTPRLVRAYFERRTDPSRDPAPPMSIESKELSYIASFVEDLHVRGYIPNVFMIGHNQPQYIYQHITSITLDVSEIGRISKGSLGTENASTDVSLAFEQADYPVLESLWLLCTKKAYLASELSNIHLRIYVGSSCNEVRIGDLVKPLSMTLNGQALAVDQPQRKWQDISVVEARECRRWYSETGSYEFNHMCEYPIQTVCGAREYWDLNDMPP